MVKQGHAQTVMTPPVPTSHTIDGDRLVVTYDGGITFDICRPSRDRHGHQLWVEIVAKVDTVVANQARINILDQRQRIDFHAVAYARDGRVDWQSMLVPIIPLVQQSLARDDIGEGTDVGADAASVDPWPVLDKTALHGLAGILTLAIDPYTEADPFAVLISLLTAFGNIVGTGAHFTVEHTKHLLRIFVVLVGMTAKGRKGTSWSTPQHIFAAIDEAWARDRVTSGLSSGEGLIFAVRDERWEKQPIKQKGRVLDYQRVLVDEGVADKRLMIVEEEFSQALKMTSREGNILSTILRQAWDS